MKCVRQSKPEVNVVYINLSNGIETNPWSPIHGIDPPETNKALYSQDDIMN